MSLSHLKPTYALTERKFYEFGELGPSGRYFIFGNLISISSYPLSNIVAVRNNGGFVAISSLLRPYLKCNFVQRVRKVVFGQLFRNGRIDIPSLKMVRSPAPASLWPSSQPAYAGLIVDDHHCSWSSDRTHFSQRVI